MKTPHLILLCLPLLLASAVPAHAQSKPAAAPLVPLEVEVIISRHDGAKRISNVPYILAVNSNNVPVQLNMSTDVAVPSGPFASPDADQKPSPLMSYQYRSVGTSIQASAGALDDGRFQLELNIDDSSVYTNTVQGPGRGTQMPAFRNFKSRNTLLLRDGQTREYTAATDRISGEVVKVSVTLRAVK